MGSPEDTSNYMIGVDIDQAGKVARKNIWGHKNNELVKTR